MQLIAKSLLIFLAAAGLSYGQLNILPGGVIGCNQIVGIPTVAGYSIQATGVGTNCAWMPGGSGGGGVTSVGASFTGGLISISGSPITTSGTLGFTISGTSGGIPYFSSSSGWGSSGVLPSGNFVLGGGAGSSPTATFSIVPVVSGGTGTSSPGLVAGTNITVSGSFPNQTINSTGGGSTFGISLAGTTSVATVTYTGTPSGAGDLRVSQPAGTQTITFTSGASAGDTAWIWLSAAGTLNVCTQSAQTFTISGTSTYASGCTGYPFDVTQIGHIAITSGNTFGTYSNDYVAGTAQKGVTGGGSVTCNETSTLFTCTGSSLSPVNTTVTFSATPTYTVSANSNPQNFLITLTSNITSSTLVTTSATSGQIISFTWCQNGTGSFTNALPSNVLGAGTLSATASACSSQIFVWDGTNANAKGPMTYSAAAAPGIQTASGLITLPTAPATLTFTVSSGTSAMGTSAIASGVCATVVTTTATGAASTDAIIWNPNASIKAVVGYTPFTADGLTIAGYPTTNNVNWDVCNHTASSITPGAVTLNWRIVR